MCIVIKTHRKQVPCRILHSVSWWQSSFKKISSIHKPKQVGMVFYYSLLALLLLLLPIILIYFLLRSRKSGKTHVPPGPPALPFIGNLHQLATTTNLHVYLWKLSKKYGPLMHMKLGSTPVFVISSASLAKEVMKTHDSSFCSRPRHLGQQKLSYNYLEVSFTPYGDYWKETRKIMVLHLLSLRKFRSFRPVREDEVSRMVQRIRDFASSRRVVNLSQMAMAYSSTLICRVAFGKRYGEPGSELPRFDELLREAQAMMAGFFVSDYLPALSWVDKLSGMIGRLEATFKKLDSFHEELIEEHLDPKREKKIDEEDDILDALIQLREQKSCPIDLNWNSIKALLTTILSAGTDSSAAAIVWTMTALMKSPNVMKKVQGEVRESISPKSHVDEDDLQKLPYLRAVIRETFRLYPPSPVVPREAIETCILEGYKIHQKTTVYINNWAIARDPEYWENPNEFFPERFLNTNIDIMGQDFGVVPFGSGRRMCPGMLMGLTNVTLAMANLIYTFDWELPPGVDAQTINTNTLPGLTVHKKDHLLLLPKTAPV